MPNNHTNNELLLLKQTAAGDEKAFQLLFISYWDKLYANALHLIKSPETARDLTQEVFIKIWLKREKLSAVLLFEPWLYRVAKNVFIDHLRKQLVLDSLHDIQSIEDNEEQSPQRKLELNELIMQVNSAIASLPAQMQAAFRLSRFHGLTHEQIAQRMNISKVTSQNYIARSLVVIRKYLMQFLTSWTIVFMLLAEKFLK
ncbi:RNA polymerase sigma factor [Niastella yeongjuensis]|uniref:RNA polymerase sigma factor n=1 Tax=Niastella yeongjuensis TaxID=354355 RepID=UPI0008B3AF7C|nr:sigma-70 family RNA polymerase sigma factor [Niastella yeongjuensis]SEO37418.1 RNA polymerase sigma-70 factor, ECF subfamily [Niastella yeongjuensis]